MKPENIAFPIILIMVIFLAWFSYVTFTCPEKYLNPKILSSFNATNNSQKELTDFADKQRILYKKTHNGY